METMLNPSLDIEALAEHYQQDQRVRVEGVLLPDVAEKIRDYISSEVTFDLNHFRNGKNASWSEKELKKMSQQELLQVQQDIWKEARNGVGFQYSGYQMEKADKNSTNPKLQYLHQVFEFLNGEEMLDVINRITDRDDLLGANAQYTRYTSGQFLTRHSDIMESAERQVAYVLGFNNHWHPDWGGLLQFYDEDGTPRDAWTPQFNCLNLFDVKHIHAVTYITPFHGEARLSLTGWFTSKPQEF